jgi:hypothetical protein
MRVRPFDVNASRAEAARLDPCVVADRNIIGIGKDAVGQIACCRKVTEVEKGGTGSVIISASWSKPVVEMFLWFTIGISASYDISGDDKMLRGASWGLSAAPGPRAAMRRPRRRAA